MHYLYRITDALNNKIYIGQSNKETERWRQHKYLARQNEPVQYIHRAIKKYGVENFTYEVIAQCLTQEDADETEILLIKQYDSRNKDKGYNVAPGGDHAWNTGLPKEQQPMYGKQQSEHQKKICSEVHTGWNNPHSDEWKQNMSKIMTGRILLDEWKNKIGQAHLGMKHTEKTKSKISEGHKGKIISNETKSKMSAASLGRTKKPFTEEHKKNLSIAHKGQKGRIISEEERDHLSKVNRRFSDDEELEMVRLWELGLSCRKIAAKFNCDANVVNRAVKRIKNLKKIPNKTNSKSK